MSLKQLVALALTKRKPTEYGFHPTSSYSPHILFIAFCGLADLLPLTISPNIEAATSSRASRAHGPNPATPIFGDSFPPFYPSFHPVDVCIATSLAKGENTNWVRCDNIAPVFQELPAYFAETKNRLPSPKDGPVQAAHKTEFTFFEYMSQPEHLSILHDFNSLMQTVSSTTSSWFDFYAFEEEIIHGLEKSANAVLLVDIAGGLGHKLQELRLKFLNLPG